uniref:Apple domain-containing protein n=1 Tax=Plectus sambesii TaxID=2011161 RepID=A0A914WV08_9BILA
MDYCVSQGGYLAHIYSSADRAAIIAWKQASSKASSICHLGLYKDSAHGKKDGTQTHWRTSTTAMLPMELAYQYDTFVDNWSVFLDILGLIVLFSDQPFTIQANEQLAFATTAAFPICEQSSPRMKATFTAYSGKRSPAPIVLSQPAQKTRRDCARFCARLPYCMGYNAITVSATSITCNYFTVKIADAGVSLVIDAATVYYELK